MSFDKIAARLQELQQRVSLLSGGRKINLIAVSKTRSVDEIRSLLQAGHMDFGENYAQEVLEKWPQIKADFPRARLHFIGNLQSNKIKKLLPLCDFFHTLDRASVIENLAKEIKKSGRLVECFLQVNIGFEPQKAGVLPGELKALYRLALDAEIKIIGLMCIPPADVNALPYFQQMRNLATEYNLENLSMGMSDDFAEAIKCGSTHIRIGTAIFGPRN